MKLICILLLFASVAASAEDFKVIKLEQDVRNLERQVSELNRQLTDLQQRTTRGSVPMESRTGGSAGVQPASRDWLNADNWKQVRAGMSELEVISILGPPTTLRGATDSADRVLLYAMEIGSSGFLGGSVSLKDRKVIAVDLPQLK